MKIEFTDRATYLAFVRDWKAEYAELSNEIVLTKHKMKAAQKAGSTEADNLQMQKASMRRKATRLLGIRADAKIEAQRQYEAEKAAA